MVAYIAGIGVGVPLAIAEGWAGLAMGGGLTLAAIIGSHQTFNDPIDIE